MKPTLKKILISIFLIGVLAALILPKFRLFQTEAKNTAADPQQVRATPVESYIVQPQVLKERVESSGTIIANEQVDLKSEVSGKVTGIHFKEGSQVSRGDLLLKINDAELQAQLLKLQQQKSLAEEQEYRQRQLLQKQAISQESYDQTKNQLENLNAEIALLNARIDKTEIRAPFDGIIGLRYVSIGDYISPSTRIASLQDIDPIKIDFSIPEKYAPVVHEDAKIQFTTGSRSKTFGGTVYAIEPRIEQETRTLQLRAVSPNTNAELLPGAYVKVELILEEYPNALLIPTEAVVPELQGQKVFLVRNGKAVPQEVTTGLRTEDKIQILSGVTPRDTVVTAGLLQLRPGAAVNITRFTE